MIASRQIPLNHTGGRRKMPTAGDYAAWLAASVFQPDEWANYFSSCGHDPE
jgi:hypothetical protein